MRLNFQLCDQYNIIAHNARARYPREISEEDAGKLAALRFTNRGGTRPCLKLKKLFRSNRRPTASQTDQQSDILANAANGALRMRVEEVPETPSTSRSFPNAHPGAYHVLTVSLFTKRLSREPRPNKNQIALDFHQLG